MSQRYVKPANPTAALPADYAPLLVDIKARVPSARLKAGPAANRELLALYWDIGRLMLDRQRREGWGTVMMALKLLTRRKGNAGTTLELRQNNAVYFHFEKSFQRALK